MDQRLAIANDSTALLQYLKDVYTLEKDLYCSKNAEARLSGEIAGMEKRVREVTPQKLRFPSLINYLSSHSSEFRFLAAMGCGILGIIMALFLAGHRSSFDFLYSISYGLHEMIDAFIGWRLVVFMALLPYLSLLVGYVIDALRFVLNISKIEANLEKENEDAKQRAEKLLNVTIPAQQANKALYTQNIQECQTALKKLYDMDVIFPKYRNLLAVAQIYEYIAAGRCSKLEGHEGAYNLYESELRQNIIIGKLDQAIQVLEEIRDTQYMIYSAIQESNKLLQQVADNTAATAYNTAVIASATQTIWRYS